MEDTVPDSTTVCRFRSVLVEADLYDTLLDEFNRQLEVKGVIVKHGAIVDASITNTPRRPRGCKSYEVVEDRKDDENTEASEKAMVKEVIKPQFGLRPPPFYSDYSPQRFFRPCFRPKIYCFTQVNLEKCELFHFCFSLHLKLHIDRGFCIVESISRHSCQKVDNKV